MSDKETAVVCLIIAIGILLTSWGSYQTGVANGICQANGYDGHQTGTWTTERPVRCTSTVYGVAQ